MPIERSHGFIRRHRVNLMDLDSDYRCITTQADRNKVRDEFPDLKKPGIIAVMGLPHTGRESICEMLGSWLRSPVYNFQGPFDALSAHQQRRHVDDDLQRLSFDVVCQMAEYYLSSENYRVNCAVVSSTFFNYTWQLDRLLAAVTQGKSGRRSPCLLIVECRRKNKFQWQLSFENEQFKRWKDVEKANQDLIRQQGGGGDDDGDYFLALARSNRDRVIKKLVVDPFEEISHNISELGGCGYSSLFTRAIRNLLGCDDAKIPIPSVVYYDKWRRHHLEEGGGGTAKRFWCRPGDCIFKLTNNTETSEAKSCEICQQRITIDYYYCKFCSLSFHEFCATNTPPEMINLPLTKIISKMMKKELHNFQACYACTEKSKSFSSFCNSCLFQTYIIKSRLLPVVFRHNVADDHPLSLRLIDGKYPYSCTACGLGGKLASYGCHICKSQYHLECLRLPLRTENRHGGHLHTIDVHFSCDNNVEDDDEYEWCLACYQDIDPKTWVYTCQDCDYVAHLHCVFPSIVKESQHLL